MIEEKLREFIITELQWNGSHTDLTNDFPLLTNGVVDSLGLMSIVSYIENEFDVEIGDDELVPDNFATIDDIAQLVKSKRGGNGPAAGSG